MRVSDGEIRALIRRGVRDMNQIKAMLNAGMGACGGRTCRQLIERIFREEGVPASEVTTLTCRPPEMEIPLGVFAGI
jgi:bacterioferritin-associated ferredoxin